MRLTGLLCMVLTVCGAPLAWAWVVTPWEIELICLGLASWSSGVVWGLSQHVEL